MKSTVSGVAVIAGFSLICHFWIFVSCDHNPCSAHNESDDAYALTAPGPALRGIDEGKWYRFERHDDDEHQGCKSFLQSGNMSEIWLYNYQAPNGADPNRSVEVCARILHGNGGCCQWNGSISLQYCGFRNSKDLYVYQLKEPPVCNNYSCSDDGVRCERSCAWNVNQSSCTCPPAYPITTGAPELKSPRVINGTTLVTDSHNPGRTFYPTKFEVDCEVKYPRQTVDDGARFDVVFEVDGRHLTHFTVDSTNPVATLDESFLAGHLGKELTCKVSSHWDSSDLRSRNFTSNSHWFGLNPVYENGSVISHNLVVKEGETASLWLEPTFPITTRPCFDLPLREPCPYSSYLFHVSTTGGFKLSECEIIFHDNSRRSAELEIAPIPGVGERPKPVVWQLNFEPYHDDANLNSQDTPAHKLPIFKGYRIQSVNIEFREQDDPPQCESIGDPHIRTFPNATGTRNFYNVYGYGVGDFYLVRLQSRLLEIQVRHVLCNIRAACTCGVIVREGNRIIGITKCNRASPLLIKYELDKDSPTGTIHTTPGGWRISLLSGIVIEVTIPYVEHLDLYVTGLESELTQYDGLCSATNVTRDSMCTLDCERYRVQRNQSLFDVTEKNLPQCGAPFFVPECTCNKIKSGETRTGDSIKIACEAPEGEHLLTINLRKACNRHKRQLDEDDAEGDDDDQDEDAISLEDFNDDTAAVAIRAAPLPQPEVDDRWLNMAYRFFGHVRSLTTPSPVLSEEDGRRRCNDALRFSATYEICSSRVDTSAIVKSCALDVEIMNDYAPTKAVPTQFETACLDSIRISLETYASSDSSGFEELKDLLTRVEKLVCPLQCSQNGRCVDSKCQCNGGYMGTDCSLTIGQVPVVRRIIMPVCDIRKHPCTLIHVEASDLTTPEDVVCKMRSVNDLDGAVPAVQTSTPVISGGLVLCKLPQMPVSVKEPENGKSTTVFLVQVSISNDGQTYSKELPFTVVDGHCMECPASQNTACQLKANTCSIGGRCYRAEVSCPQDDTMICNPSICATRWTGESSTSCDDGFENCT